MIDSDENNNPPKKAVSRKKIVDLKAVAALLDDGEEVSAGSSKPAGEAKQPEKSFYKPDEDLIQTTSRIKSQRDLIQSRIKKMEQGKNRVSRTVYDKVYRDYMMQSENINNLLNEKKALLQKELKKLYLLREKQSVEINRHKEILEEARFRNFLEEFSEEQYREVEEYESREIAALQSELSQIASYLKVHEELFDPEDLGLSPRSAEPEKTIFPPIPPFSKTDVTKTIMPQTPPAVAETPHKQLSTTIRSEAREPFSGRDSFAEKTPLPATPASGAGESRIDELMLDSDEKGYFDTHDDLEISMRSEKAAPQPAKPAVKTALQFDLSKTDVRKEKEPESIFDVLQEMSPEPEVSSATSPVTASASATPAGATLQAEQPVQTKAPDNYKLVFKEVVDEKFDLKEIALKDNISIGRSPSNDLVFQAPKVSRQHAAINKYKDQYIIIDLKSSNGVFVNGRKIDEHALSEGDEISIGGYKMIFQKA